MRTLLNYLIIAIFISMIISCEKTRKFTKEINRNKLTSLTNFVGYKKEKIINLLGTPDSDSNSNLLKWEKFHIQCYLRNKYISSISFKKGFKGKVSNISIGTTKNKIISVYGQPDVITNQNHKFVYFYQGLLFWLNDKNEVDNIIYSKNNFNPENKKWNNLLNITNFLGQTKEKVFDFLGTPNRNVHSIWYFWDQNRISCLFRENSMYEIRFSHWFKGKLKSNIGFGSSEKDVLDNYGKPTSISENPKRFKYKLRDFNIVFTFKFNNISSFSISK